MAITIFDYVKSIVGDKPEYTAEDFYGNGVELLGGCEYCHATIAAYNAYPSKSGYWRCADCVGSIGYDTVAEFISKISDADVCPECCAASSGIIEIFDETEGVPALQCGECHHVFGHAPF